MKCRLLRAQEVPVSARERMLELMGRSFLGVDRRRFETDLEEKNWVLLLEDDRGALCGFSTLLFYRARVDGVSANIVYSGDTVVDRQFWNGSILSPAWITAVRRLHDERPAETLHWLLITSGYRTYRFLPVFFREFFPRCKRPAPLGITRLMERLARDRFGVRYDAVSGIVRLARPQVLVAELRGIPPGRLTNDDVAFFAQANPGHESGDELVCLTSLGDDNLTPAGRRMLARGRDLCEIEVAA